MVQVQTDPKVAGQVDVQVSISFEALVEAIRTLSIQDKHRLLDIFEEMVGQEEMELLLAKPEVQAEIAQAMADYEAGDYITIDEYLEKMAQEEE